MVDVARRRCSNHSHREAVARCPDCGDFYCRECVTEHDGRMTCAACLQKSATDKPSARSVWRPLFRVVQLMAACMAMWYFFNLAGWLLLRIPTPMHEGTFWRLENRETE